MQLRSGTSLPQHIASSADTKTSRKRSLPVNENHSPTAKRFKLTTENLVAHTKSTMPCPKRPAVTQCHMNAESQHSGQSFGDQPASFPTPDSTTTSESRRTTSSHPSIVPVLIENGIDPFQFPSRRPDDFDDLVKRINRRRVSPSPTKTEFDEHCANFRDAASANKALVNTTWTRWLSKEPSEFSATFKRTWSGFLGMKTAGRAVPATPDFAQCRSMIGVPQEALEKLGSTIQPCPDDYRMMPHFIAEHKAPEFSTEKAIRQTALYGAIIVQGDRHVFQYTDTPFPVRKTRAISAAYNGTSVRVDAHYFDDTGLLPYAHTPIGFYYTWTSLEDYSRARRAIRNAQDFGREKSQEVYDMLAGAALPVNNKPDFPSQPNTEDQPEWKFTKDFWYREHSDGTIEHYDAAQHGELPLHRPS